MKVFKSLSAFSGQFFIAILKILGRIRYLKEANDVRTLWVAYYYLRRFLKWKDINDYDVIAENSNVKDDNTIWIYWKQGYDQAPPLVKKCILSAKRHSCNYRVVVLDDNNRRDYIKFPEFIERKHDENIIKEALFSDLLRISLLIHYGGIWCDATCLWTSELPKIISEAELFMFSESEMRTNLTPIKGSNWFIKAKKSDAILVKTKNCLFHFWAEHSYPPNYFIFHLILSLIVREDVEAKKQWESMPYICNMNPHVMQFSFAKPYSRDSFESIKSQCFIHKLTYKYDRKLLDEPINNILKYIVEYK